MLGKPFIVFANRGLFWAWIHRTSLTGSQNKKEECTKTGTGGWERYTWELVVFVYDGVSFVSPS
jgi:hypothetical protein